MAVMEFVNIYHALKFIVCYSYMRLFVVLVTALLVNTALLCIAA